jgi:hypothetical protein
LCVGVLCAVRRDGEVARGVHALSGDVKRESREGPGRMWAGGARPRRGGPRGTSFTSSTSLV